MSRKVEQNSEHPDSNENKRENKELHFQNPVENINTNLLLSDNDSKNALGTKNPFSIKPIREQETPPYWCPRCKQHVNAEFRTSGQLSIGQRLELSCKCGSKMLYKSRTDRRIMLETI